MASVSVALAPAVMELVSLESRISRKMICSGYISRFLKIADAQNQEFQILTP